MYYKPFDTIQISTHKKCAIKNLKNAKQTEKHSKLTIQVNKMRQFRTSTYYNVKMDVYTRTSRPMRTADRLPRTDSDPFYLYYSPTYLFIYFIFWSRLPPYRSQAVLDEFSHTKREFSTGMLHSRVCGSRQLIELSSDSHDVASILMCQSTRFDLFRYKWGKKSAGF